MEDAARIKRISKIVVAIAIVLLIMIFSVSIVKIKRSNLKVSEIQSEGETIMVTTLKGHVNLGATKEATVELYNDDNEKLNTQETGNSGNFEFSLDTEDNYYIKIIQLGYLDFQTTPIEINYGYNITLNDITMRFGDFNGDNEIELMDLIKINDNYKIVNAGEICIFDSNGDNKVNEQDRESLKLNYGLGKLLDEVEYLTSYTIDYNANGGENAPEYQLKDNGVDINLATEIPIMQNKTFKGWAETADAEEATYLAEDLYQENRPLRLYAVWGNTEYNITYKMDGGTNTNYNPSTYTSFDPDINLVEPTKDGYEFTGWKGSNGEEPQKDVTIPNGSSGDKEFNAIWTPLSGVKYKVEYYTEDLNQATFTLDENQELEGTTDELVTAPQIEIPGFTFDEDNVNNVIQGTVQFDESLVLKLYYSRNSYNLNAIAGQNIKSTTGSGTYKYQQEVTVNAVLASSADYKYLFENWTSNNAKVENSTEQVYTFNMPDVNIDITANAKQMAITDVVYKVQYYKENLTAGQYTLAETTTLTGTSGQIVTATKKTYTGFTFSESNGSNVLSGKVIADGSLVLKVYYTRNSYVVTASKGTYISAVTGGGTYKYGQTVTLGATLASATGYTYTFSKWTSSDTAAVANSTNKTTTFTMPAKAITMTASATRVAIKYTITYTLNSGTVATANPTSYTIASSAITLTNPTRTGYTFTGWTGTNGTTPSKTITIAQGSTGNRSYTANWTDNIAPTVPTLVATGTAGNNDWYKSNVSVKITSGTDSGSGVSSTKYSLSGATTKALTAITSGSSITISAEGSTVITAHTYDKSGNYSTKTMTIKKDTIAPTINIAKATFSGATLSKTTAKVTATGYATDATSGISSYSYYNGTSWQTSGTITSTTTGTKFRYRAYDKAGNVSYSTEWSYLNRFILVTQLYEKMLGRVPVMSDVYFWAITRYNSLVDEGYTAVQMQKVALEIGISDEANAISTTEFVNRLYPAYFGRAYENTAAKTAISNMLSSGTRRSVIVYLLKSEEFKTTCTKWGFPFSTTIQ